MSIWSLTGLVSRRLAVAGACAIALVACGGGGGGGGPSSISYTGSTSQATINGSNATALAGSAFASGDAGASANVLGVASGSVSQPVEQRSIKVANVLQSAVGKIDLRSSSSMVIGTTQTDSQTFNGPCGGSFSYTISFDDVTGNFNGSLSFNGYCEQTGSSISGHVSLSGQIDLTPNPPTLFKSLAFDATYLALVDNGSNFAISGTVAFVFSGSSATVTENFRIQDGSGKVYKVANLVIVLTNTLSDVQETLNGRFYHPDHGYVDVVTNTTFVIPTGYAYPTSGSLTINGAGSTKAVLTALSDGTYTLDIDVDGDGITDQTKSGDWVDL